MVINRSFWQIAPTKLSNYTGFLNEDWDTEEDGQQMALDALRNRYLVEERIDAILQGIAQKRSSEENVELVERSLHSAGS